MLKNILNLKGVKTLSKAEQRNVKGGFGPTCNPVQECCHSCTCGLNTYFIYPGKNCNICNGVVIYPSAGCV